LKILSVPMKTTEITKLLWRAVNESDLMARVWAGVRGRRQGLGTAQVPNDRKTAELLVVQPCECPGF